MSVVNVWVGDNTDTTCQVVCRANATEQVSVSCNGGVFTANAVSSVNDGVVAVLITGLSENTRYTFTVDSFSGELKTLNKSDEVWIATGSCWGFGYVDEVAHKLYKEYDLDLYVALGDLPYTAPSNSGYGETPTSVVANLIANTTAENYSSHHRQSRRFSGISEIMRNVPFMYMGDDHEYPFDNASYDLTEYQTSADITSWSNSATQQNLDDAWAACREAMVSYSTGNPLNSDASIDSDALYSRKTYGNNLVEVFLIDCMNYRSAVGATDNASKTMLGAIQTTWLKSKLASSTSTFKIIMTGKMFFDGGGNNDTWVQYTAAMDDLLADIDAQGVTGVFALAGDNHYPSAQFRASPPMLCVVGCPTAQSLNVTQGSGYPTDIIWKYGKFAGTGAPEIRVSNLVKVTPEYCEISILSANKGILWTGRINAGSNELIYPDQQVAI